MSSLTDLTVQQLQCFVAVAEEGQFTRAADRLHVAQPSVSFQIRRMEAVVGARLFHRGRGPAALTDAGVALLPLARRVLADLGQILTRAADLHGLRTGHVSIGATPSLATALLPSLLSRFHRSYPGITLEVTERDSLQLAEGLVDGTLDLAVAVFPLHHPELEHVPLAAEEMVAVVEHGHPLADRASIRMADLEGVPMIMFHEGYELRTMTLDAFEAAGLYPTVSVEGAEVGSVLSLVAAGLGAAIVPSIIIGDSPGVDVLRIARPALERQIGLVRHSSRTLSLAAAAMCEEIDAHLAEAGWPGAAVPGVRLATR